MDSWIIHKKEGVLGMGVNQLANSALLVCSDRIELVDLNNNMRTEWSFAYTKTFTEELFDIPWSTEHVRVLPMTLLNAWICIFNRRYMKIIYSPQYVSKFYDWVDRVDNMEYNDRSNLLILQKKERKVFGVYSLVMDDYFAGVMRSDCRSARSLPLHRNSMKYTGRHSTSKICSNPLTIGQSPTYPRIFSWISA